MILETSILTENHCVYILYVQYIVHYTRCYKLTILVLSTVLKMLGTAEILFNSTSRCNYGQPVINVLLAY